LGSGEGGREGKQGGGRGLRGTWADERRVTTSSYQFPTGPARILSFLWPK
jgi:hypothetical protein